MKLGTELKSVSRTKLARIREAQEQIAAELRLEQLATRKLGKHAFACGHQLS